MQTKRSKGWREFLWIAVVIIHSSLSGSGYIGEGHFVQTTHRLGKNVRGNLGRGHIVMETDIVKREKGTAWIFRRGNSCRKKTLVIFAFILVCTMCTYLYILQGVLRTIFSFLEVKWAKNEQTILARSFVTWRGSGRAFCRLHISYLKPWIN